MNDYDIDEDDSNWNLEDYELEELEELQKEVARRISQLRVDQREQAIKLVRELVAKFDLQSVVAKRDRSSDRKRAPRTKRPVKFLNPETGESWVGRGRKPNWLVGKDLEQYRIHS